jgi:hypothetical protein
MKPNEQLRNYTNRFFQNSNTCVDVKDNEVIDSYKKGIRDCKIFEKVDESGATTVATPMEVVNMLINTDEVLVT